MKFDLKTKLKSLKSLKDNRHFVSAFLLLIIISIYVSHKNKQSNPIQHIENLQPDTIIPKGFILYPIQLQNIETIKGLISQFGVIDVYGGISPGKNKKLLSKVKILQAPYNPNEYALLLPEHLSQKLMLESGPFLGVIQNRSEQAEFENKDVSILKKRIQIEYQKDI